MSKYEVIIIGGGASGLMCAIEAGKRGRSVLILEHSEKPGKKILISGGGRCNFTNLDVNPGNFISHNPHFCKSALNRFTQHDFLGLVNNYGIKYYEKTQGQLFCSTRSKEILNMLLSECKNHNVEIKTDCTISNITKVEHFIVCTGKEYYECQSLVIATGGLSIPLMGSTAFGYEVAKQFGINVIECRPALVGLTLSRELLHKLGNLSGVSIDASVSCAGQSFKESILFTHKGLSGPAILQISNYWNCGDEIELDLLPGIDISQKIKEWQKESPKAELKNLLCTLIPKRIAHQFAEFYFNSMPVIQYNFKETKDIENRLHKWCITPTGTEGFEKAEVTRGGIDTGELSSKTFESKKIKGLYFIGEVVDVTGWLGGYNFQWAWSSGFCAGQFV